LDEAPLQRHPVRRQPRGRAKASRCSTRSVGLGPGDRIGQAVSKRGSGA